MRIERIMAVLLSAILVITSLTACETVELSPPDSVEITTAETEFIESMIESGTDESEIAETLMTIENSESSDIASSEEFSAESRIPETTGDVSSAATPVPTKVPVMSTNTPTLATVPHATITSAPSVTKVPTAAPKLINTPTPTAKPTNTPTPKPTTAPSGQYLASAEEDAIRYINAVRKARAVAKHKTYYVPVVMNSGMRDQARTRAKEIVNDFSHRSASGKDLSCENIFQGGGKYSAKKIIDKWESSNGHYTNMIFGCTSKNDANCKCGVGVWYCDGQTYAVMGIKSGDKGTGQPSGYTEPTDTTVPKPTETTASDDQRDSDTE